MKKKKRTAEWIYKKYYGEKRDETIFRIMTGKRPKHGMEPRQNRE